MKTGTKLGNTRNLHPERSIIYFETYLGDCENAESEATRQATAQPFVDNYVPTTLTELEDAYACKGDYQKALDYHMQNLKQSNQTDEDCGCQAETAIYLNQLGRNQEAYDLINKAIFKNPNYFGGGYFTRAVIEFDLGEYDKALDDANHAEGNSWAHGMFFNYIEGLNAERLGNTQEAITKLQDAEASFGPDTGYAMRRARTELKKLGAEPLTIKTSANVSSPPIPVYPTSDTSKIPTYNPNPTTK